MTLPWFGICWLTRDIKETILPEGIESALEAAKRMASFSSGLLVQSSGSFDNKLPDWVSSLWTLQEPIMRLDMLLLNKT